MARKVVLVDDLDGKSEATDTVLWGLDGEFYELDLSKPNAEKLRTFLDPYKKASRVTAAPRARRSGGNGSYDPQEVRNWATAQGREISDKGPIPTNILADYERSKAQAAPASA
jgi:hypothetical protein